MKNRTCGKFATRFLLASALLFGAITLANAAVNPSLMSQAPNGDNGNGLSQNESVSADGRYVVFESQATNLISGLTDTNAGPDIFVRDMQTGVLRCLSGVTAANPTTTGNGLSVNPIISANGRYVVFASQATNLVDGIDLNNDLDVFRFDLQTNIRELVSVNALGSATGNSYSGNTLGGWHTYVMSDDGRYVAFMSNASDLTIISDTNAKSDIFLRDMQTSSTRLVSINKNGTGAANDDSYDPSITADGQSVAFTSLASDLIAVDLNDNYDIFVYNYQTQVTKCASLAVSGGNGTGDFGSFAAVISKDGSRVAYFTAADDLTNINIPFANPHESLIVHDLPFNINLLVSIDATGTTYANDEVGIGNFQQRNVSISANGRYITFESRATNLTPNTTATYNIFRRDLALSRTELVTFNAAGTGSATQNSFVGQRGGAMSRDGRFITFYSGDANLTSDFPGSFAGQIYVRDMANGITTALTLNSSGTALSSGPSGIPIISANGRTAVFESDATDLAPTHVNNSRNVYRALIPTPQRAIADFDGDGVSDYAVYRPAQGAWYVLNNPRTFASYRLFGNAADLIVPADYNGDGRADYAVFRPSAGTWYISDSLSFGETAVQFGQAGDLPIPQDYDGDGRTDIAVFRNGTWYVLSSLTGQVTAIQFGLAGDIPVPGDFDGDGKADIAVFRPADGNWYIRKSESGALQTVHFGQSGDKPVPADYDGDGKTDIGVFRGGTWWILNSRNNGVTNTQWGLASDIPAAGEYDGDGKTDITVFRPSEGTWYVIRSSDGTFFGVHFGQTGDAPIPAAYIP